MKSHPALLATFLLLASSIFAQSLEPGVYTAPDGRSRVSIKLEGDRLIHHDGRWTSEYFKIGQNRYKLKDYATIIMLDETGAVVVTDETGSFKQVLTMYSPANATPAPGVIDFESHGDRYYAAASQDPRFVGTYKTESRGAWGPPIVQLEATGKGVFQPHGVAPIPLDWWMETTPAGELQKIKGVAGDRYTLVVRYGPGGGGNYPEGRFQRMQLDLWPDKAVIMGERVKPL